MCYNKKVLTLSIEVLTKMLDFNKILKKLIKEADITMTSLALNIGVSKQYLSEAITKNRNISSDKYIKIFNYFDNLFTKQNKVLNFRWFLTGDGSMFLNEPEELDFNVKVVKLKKGQLLKIEYDD